MGKQQQQSRFILLLFTLGRWLDVNQSYNAVFNYCNRSGMEMTTEQQAVSYVLATGNDFFLL
ncbi:hypothetical protein Pmar_PMAR007988, partial [Perkinsus marinus ATCC 50983]